MYSKIDTHYDQHLQIKKTQQFCPQCNNNTANNTHIRMSQEKSHSPVNLQAHANTAEDLSQATGNRLTLIMLHIPSERIIKIQHETQRTPHTLTANNVPEFKCNKK